MQLPVFERWAKDEEEIPIHHETLTINVNKKKIDFNIIHNFNFLHLDIYKALEEWANQTLTFTIHDFCRFVMTQPSPEKELICIPEDEWNEFQINQANRPS